MDGYNSPLPSRSEGPTTISSLSAEILTRIFEELQDADPQSINAARRVCRAFNDLAVPIAYRTVHIKQQIIDPSAATLLAHVLPNMHMHTRHVVLRSGLDRNSVRSFLNSLQKLRSIRYICLPLISETPGLTRRDLRWSFICSTGPTYDRWVPSDIYGLTSHDPARIKIHIEGLPVGALDGKQADLYRSVIPTNNLVSLETALQMTSSEPYLPSLKQLLLESRSLEVFRYRGSGAETRFDFDKEERCLPAFKELTLRAYEWTHRGEETARNWDFSRIRALELVSMSVFNFFSSVHLEDFANLHTLRVDDSGTDRDQDRDQPLPLYWTGHHRDGVYHTNSRTAAASIMVHSLVRDHIRSLSSLELITRFNVFPIDALLRHSSTLKHLIFRDPSAFTDDYVPSQTLRLAQIRKLARSMNKLHTLELDVDILHKDSTRFLLQICKFPELRNLTLNIQTVVDSGTWYTRTSHWYDPDDKCARTIFELLRRHKTGLVEWEKITIRVGGWQSVMARRVGEIWRSFNKRGVFAKRCFVLERAAAKPGAGQHGPGENAVTELRYVEWRLGEGYPWPE